MKRDWDLIRELMIGVEEEKDFLADEQEIPKWGDQTEQEYVQQLNAVRAANARIFGHLEMLVDNGYLDGVQVIRTNDGGFRYGLSDPRLTMAGHDLLDTMRSSVLWESIKTTAKKKGIELTFDAIKAIGVLAITTVLGAA